MSSMDDIKLILHNPTLGKFPQKDGGGSITFFYSRDQHLKATAVALAGEERNFEVGVKEIVVFDEKD